MILKSGLRKFLLFFVFLFFAGMIGSRFYSFVKPRRGPTPSAQKRAVPPPKTKDLKRADPFSRGPFEDHILIVADGDSVVGKKGGRIRYLGVDAPEKGEPLADQALRFNKDLVYRKDVRVEPCLKRPWDKYGRRLAHVFVKDMNVSQRLLEEGYARVYDDPVCNGDTKEALWRAMNRAYDEKKGLWADTPSNAIPAGEAIRHVNQTRKVTGEILEIVKGKTFYFAHYNEDWRTDGLSLRFPIDDLQRLGFDPSALTGNRVTAIGKIEKKDFGPFITIFSPEQILEGK